MEGSVALFERIKHEFLDRSIREHSGTSEMLIWLSKERADWPNLVSPDLMTAILGAIEREQHNEISRGGRLRDLLIDDRELIADMEETSSSCSVRNH